MHLTNTHLLTDDFSQIMDENGLRYWINQRTGERLSLVISGAADDEEDEPDDEDEVDEEDEEDEEDDDKKAEVDKAKSKKSKSEKSVPQAEVTRIMAREKRQGKEAGKRELRKELGLGEDDDLDEFKAWQKKQREEEDKKLSDADRAAKSATRAERDAAKVKEEAADERFAARLERSLSRAGVSEDDMEDAVVLLGQKIHRDDEPDKEDIETAVKKLKKRHAGLFGEKQEGDTRTPNGDPGGSPRGRGKLSPADAATALLAKRHPKKETATA